MDYYHEEELENLVEVTTNLTHLHWIVNHPNSFPKFCRVILGLKKNEVFENEMIKDITSFFLKKYWQKIVFKVLIPNMAYMAVSVFYFINCMDPNVYQERLDGESKSFKVIWCLNMILWFFCFRLEFKQLKALRWRYLVDTKNM